MQRIDGIMWSAPYRLKSFDRFVPNDCEGVYIIWDMVANHVCIRDVGSGNDLRTRLAYHLKTHPDANFWWTWITDEEERLGIEAFLADRYGLREQPGHAYPDVPRIEVMLPWPPNG